MEWKLIVGVDVSKQTVDVTFFEAINMKDHKYCQFANTENGYKEMLKWIRQSVKFSKEQILFCLENTGVYSLRFSALFTDENYFLWVENPLQVKRSLGIKRGKNDKLDSYAIANYAYRFRDKAKRFKMPSKTLLALQDLEAYRGRLVRYRQALKQAAGELFEDKSSTVFITKSTCEDVIFFDSKIEEVENKVEVLIKQDEELKKLFDLVVSVKGIGPQTAIYMLIHTQAFTSFETSRQFACYCGVAPFEHSSGSSIMHKSKVSHIANKKIKSLLQMCGRSAVMHDKELKVFYERKLAEGKKENCVMNIIKNKLIYRVFAVVKREKLFMNSEDYKAYKKAA